MKKILIVKIGAIGDVVMCLPLISEIRNKEPDARITWLCGKQVLSMLERVEGIDELIAVDENALLKSSLPVRIGEILRIWSKLLFRNFNLQLYYYHSLLYKILCLPAFSGETRGFGKQKSGSMLPVPGRHHSLEYIRAYLNGDEPAEIKPEYPRFRNLPGKSGLSGRKRIVLASGGARNLLRNDGLRRWPLQQYAQLGRLIADKGWELILTGSEGDAWVKEAFSEIPFTDMIGKQNLCEFIDFLAGTDLLVTHDSGPLHLADLADCPVLGLFGPTIPEEKKSLQKNSDYLWGGAHLSCRPCYDGRNYGRCAFNECLGSISPKEVFEKISLILSA